MDIIVEGKGSKVFTPNEVILEMNFQAKGAKYEEVLALGVQIVQTFIDTVLVPNGFQQDAFKTNSFVVREEKKYDEKNKEYIFVGYSYHQNARLEFDYDKEKMAKLVAEIAALENAPYLQVRFGLKNERECRRQILALAYQDAEYQAQTIAAAAEKDLKTCVKVDFQSFSNRYLSATTFGVSRTSQFLKEGDTANRLLNTFTPEDIELTEKLYCLWQAE